MTKKYNVVITVEGDGSPEKKQELVEKVLEAIKIAGERSLGNLQAAVTITEKA